MTSKELGPSRLRLDKWLWFARFFKTRSLATRACMAGRLRVNGERCNKASSMIKAGDSLTFVQGEQVRVIKIVSLGERRGPAPEARALYEDLAPPEPKKKEDPKSLVAARLPGAGRPTKRERRATDRLKGEESG